MLIINRPIELQSISTLNIHSDVLGEKISANYRMIGTNITSEELLHMTMLEPQVYVGIQNGSTLVVENNIHEDNQLKLDLINQMINRVLLYHSPQFTYQDEVFVTSILQKLGVSDVNAFMQQVKLHMSRNEFVTTILNKYFNYGRDIADEVDKFVDTAIYEENELDVIKNVYQTDWYLHNDVFKRLMTAECNNEVYAYHNQNNTSESSIKSIQDVTWIEQADAIQLSQFRQNMFYQTNPAMWQEYMRYEMEPISVYGLTEEKVIQRIGMAVLENLIQKISYGQQYVSLSKNSWNNYTGVLYQSAEGVVERFKYYQNERTINAVQIRNYGKIMKELIHDEIQLTQLLYFIRVYDDSEVVNAIYEDIERNIVLSVMENQSLQKQITERMKFAEYKSGQAQEQVQNIYIEEQKEYEDALQKAESAYYLLRQKGNDNYLSSIDIEHIEQQSNMMKAYEQYAEGISEYHNKSLNEMDNKTIIEKILHNQTIESIQNQVTVQGNSTTDHQDNYLLTFFNQYADIINGQEVPITENVELLNQINAHNLYMKQLLDSRKDWHADPPKRVVVDREQARKTTLRALEDPQSVLNEIYESGTAIERELPEEIEKILSITDENTRLFYEQLLGYHNKVQNINSENLISNTSNAVEISRQQLVDILNSTDETVLKKNILELNNNLLDSHVSNTENMQNTVYIDNMVYENEQIHGANDVITNQNVSEHVFAKTQKMEKTVQDFINLQRTISKMYGIEPGEENRPDEITKEYLHMSVQTQKMEKTVHTLQRLENIINKICEKMPVDEMGGTRENTQFVNRITENSSELYEQFMEHYEYLQNEGDETTVEQKIQETKISLQQATELLNSIKETVVKKNTVELLYSLIDNNISNVINRNNTFVSNQNHYEDIQIHGTKDVITNQNVSEHVFDKTQKMEETVQNLINLQRTIYRMYGIDSGEENQPYEITKEHLLSVSDENISTLLEQVLNSMEMHQISEAEHGDTDEITMFQTDVYEFLHKIEQKEKGYKVLEETLSRQTEETIHSMTAQKVQREMLDNSIENVRTQERFHMIMNESIPSLHEYEKNLELIHKAREQMSEEIVDEVLEALESSSITMKNLLEKQEETVITQKQLQDIKNEIITQSEEHIQQFVNQNLKTQIHSISDMVYLELERKLKNEQRRRGYR